MKHSLTASHYSSMFVKAIVQLVFYEFIDLIIVIKVVTWIVSYGQILRLIVLSLKQQSLMNYPA